MSVHLDLYSFGQGKQFALDMFRSSRLALSERFVIKSVIGNIERALKNKPPSFAMGAMEVIKVAKEAI